MDYARKAWPVWVPIGMVLIAATAIFFMGYPELAGLVANLGTAIALLVIIGIVVIFDPANKWPNRGFRDRLALLMTFGKADLPPATIHSLDETRHLKD